MNQTTRSDVLILLAAAIWGTAFYFQKTAMLHIGPLLFLGLRAAVAGLALLPLALREQQMIGAGWKDVLPIATAGGVMFFTAGAVQQSGIVTATVINTGLLTALYIVATPFAFWAIERQRPAGTVWLAVLIAITGVWCLSGGSVGRFSTGDLLVALSAIGWGTQIVITGRAGRLARPFTYTCLQFMLVALISLSLAALSEPISVQAIVAAADSLLFVGFLSTALTFAVMAHALQHIPAPRASIILSTEVLFSTAAGYLLLGERLTLLGWLGAVLILVAVLVVRLRRP